MSCLLPRLDLWNLPTEKTEDEKRERQKKNNRRKGKEGEGRGKKCSKVLACISLSLSLSIFIYISLFLLFFSSSPSACCISIFSQHTLLSLLNIGCFNRYFENIGHYGRYLIDIMRYALIRTATDITLRYCYSSDRYRYVSADNPNPLIDSLQFQVDS